MTKPLIVYLDTQDYIAFARKNDHAAQEVRSYLFELLNKNQIIAPNSCPLMLELLQDFDERHLRDRLRRARELKWMTRGHAFRWLVNPQKNGGLNSNGLWNPIDKDLSLQQMLMGIREMFKDKPGFEKLVSDIKKYGKNRPIKLSKYFSKPIDYSQQRMPVTKRFVRLDMFGGFFTGRYTLREVNNELRKMYTDPVIFVHSAFRQYKFVNNFSQMSTSVTGTLELGINRFFRNAHSPTHDDVKSEIMQLGKRFPHGMMMSNFMKEILVLYIEAHLMDKDRAHRSSDFADILHADFVPYCDLFRTDKAFGALLKKRGDKEGKKIVSRLIELPNRIDDLL